MATSSNPETEVQDGVTIISLGPAYENLDEHLLEDVSVAILKSTTAADPPLVVLDLSHTKFFGSAFIEILFRAWNRVQSKAGGRFVISGLTEYCLDVIKVTHLDQLWDVYETRAEAIAAVKSNS